MNHLTNFVFGIFASLSAVVSTVLPVNKPAITPIPANVIVRSGEYSYSGQTLKYNVHIPKDGGKITGNLTGVCSGPIEGDYSAGPAQEAEGKASATCPILFGKKLTATYTAHFNFKEGKVYIDWQGDIPYTQGHGSFTIDFEPVN